MSGFDPLWQTSLVFARFYHLIQSSTITETSSGHLKKKGSSLCFCVKVDHGFPKGSGLKTISYIQNLLCLGNTVLKQYWNTKNTTSSFIQLRPYVKPFSTWSTRLSAHKMQRLLLLQKKDARVFLPLTRRQELPLDQGSATCSHTQFFEALD